MNKKILIFGYTGGIGSELIKILKNKKYDLILLNKKKLNFNSNNANKKIHKILKIYNPDIIINAAGILGSNKDDYTKIYNINLMPNWEVVKYYKKTKFTKKNNFNNFRIFILQIRKKKLYSLCFIKGSSK